MDKRSAFSLPGYCVFVLVIGVFWSALGGVGGAASSYGDFVTRFLAQKPSGAVFVPEMERHLGDLVNGARLRNGRLPLQVSRKMERAARAQALDLALSGRVDHASRSGATPRERVVTFLPEVTAFGENAARDRRGGSLETRARALMGQWMGSSGHRRILLSPLYTSVSSGVVRYGGHIYAVQIFWDQGASSPGTVHFQ